MKTDSLYGFMNFGKNKIDFVSVGFKNPYMENFYSHFLSLRKDSYLMRDRSNILKYSLLNFENVKNNLSFFEGIKTISKNKKKLNNIFYLNTLCYLLVFKNMLPEKRFRESFGETKITRADYIWKSEEREIHYVHKNLDEILEKFSNISVKYNIDPVLFYINPECFLSSILSYVFTMCLSRKQNESTFYDAINMPRLKFEEIFVDDEKNKDLCYETLFINKKASQMIFDNIAINHYLILQSTRKNFHDYNHALFFSFESKNNNLQTIEKKHDEIKQLNKMFINTTNIKFISYYENRYNLSKTFVILFKNSDDAKNYCDLLSITTGIKVGLHDLNDFSYLMINANLDCVKEISEFFF